MRKHRQIALLGFPGVGKSSLAHHFVYQHFSDVYDPNIKTNLQHQCDIGNEQYDLLIVDNAGSDQYTIHHSDFENSDAYILIYAVDDRQSFDMVSIIRDKLILASTNLRIPMILVGNKIDRKTDRVVTTEEGRLLAGKWNVPFVEVSAMDFEVVRRMFEKSVYTMDNANSIETVTDDKSTKTQSNEVNSSSRTGPMKKVNGNVSSRDQSSKQSCIIS